MIEFARWMLWNLFLAILPVALGYTVAVLGRQAGRHRTVWLLLAPMFGLWFIFLPNSCYLFTEPVHLLAAVEEHNLWPRARHDTGAAMSLGLWTAVSLCYVAVGALSFALAIRPVRTLGEQAGLRVSRWAGPFFLLMAIGVYLGRIVRYNSWDFLTRPLAVLETVASLASRPVLMMGIVLFGLFLWLAYVAADIWVDGAALRWRRWSRSKGEAWEGAAPEYCGQRG
jgi:uncharacterized membrane protein